MTTDCAYCHGQGCSECLIEVHWATCPEWDKGCPVCENELREDHGGEA